MYPEFKNEKYTKKNVVPAFSSPEKSFPEKMQAVPSTAPICPEEDFGHQPKRVTQLGIMGAELRALPKPLGIITIHL